ncbi:MAG: hypothetical protein O7I42_05885 [Alphaproteobacteria bacterium]|nr:hypothetical protein [Alphaproteobacteria bacterium]
MLHFVPGFIPGIKIAFQLADDPLRAAAERFDSTEIDHINGAIPVLGAEVGVPAPTNEMVSALVRALEEGFG